MIAPTQIHELAGCTPTPLAHYLKALAVLRLIAEQADPQVRGWWKGERFFLLTRLDRPALLQFFLTTYAPTPLIAPWNGGSGFFPKDNTEGPDAIAHSPTPPAFAPTAMPCSPAKRSPTDSSSPPKRRPKPP
jgi:CRISPR-associated protein Csx17